MFLRSGGLRLLSLLAAATTPSLAEAGPAYSWVRGQGSRSLPGEVIGGRESGRELAVCRARHRGGLHPGKRVAGNCNIGYGGKEIVSRGFEVMVWREGRPRWSSTVSRLPSGALRASTYDGRPGYVCRASYRGGMHPGKVVKNRCNIGYGGKELVLGRYQVLLEPPPLPPSSAELSWSRPGARGQVVGGREAGRQLVVCRGLHDGAMHPGKVVASRCNIATDGREVRADRFEVLVARGGAVQWSPESNRVPGGAFPAARYDGRTGQVCRVRYRGGLHPGKVSGNACAIGYGGREIRLGRFETLLGSSRGGSLSSPLLKTARPPIQDRRSACERALQGRVKVDGSGRRNWRPAEISRLCRGGRDDAPARCYAQLMSGRVSWGKGTDWQSSNANNLCAGSQNGPGTIACFERELRRTGDWRQAIPRCNRR